MLYVDICEFKIFIIYSSVIGLEFRELSKRFKNISERPMILDQKCTYKVNKVKQVTITVNPYWPIFSLYLETSL